MRTPSIKLTKIHYGVNLRQNLTSSFQVMCNFLIKNRMIAVKVRG